MLRLKANDSFARKKVRFFISHKASVLDELIMTLASDNQSLIAVGQNFVLGIGIYRDREVCGQCPRRSCPNGNTHGLVSWQTGFSKLVGRKWKSHVNGGVVALLIFHFGFG